MTKEEYSSLIEKLVVIDYWTPEEHITMKDYEDQFRQLIERRIQHCEEQLKANLHRANSLCDGQIIVWPRGHFSYPVYEALVNSRDVSIEEWNALVWEQVIRQMARSRCDDMIMYDIASEGCLCGGRY